MCALQTTQALLQSICMSMCVRAKLITQFGMHPSTKLKVRESVEYSGLVNVSPGNPWVWVLPGPLDITGCRMDIQEDDIWGLLQLLCSLHNNTEHTVKHVQCSTLQIVQKELQ